MSKLKILFLGVGEEKLSWNFFKQSMGAWNRVGRGLLYRPPRLHRLAE